MRLPRSPLQLDILESVLQVQLASLSSPPAARDRGSRPRQREARAPSRAGSSDVASHGRLAPLSVRPTRPSSRALAAGKSRTVRALFVARFSPKKRVGPSRA